MRAHLHRSLWSFVAGVLLLLTAPTTTQAFEAQQDVELPNGVRVEIDGRGSLRALLGDIVLLEVQQVLVYGEGDAARFANLSPDGPVRIAASTAVVDQTDIGLVDTKLVSRTHSWRYFHVDDIAFLDSFIEPEDASIALPARAGIKWTSPYEVDWIERKLRPHLSTGRAENTRLEIAHFVCDVEDGERIHLGVLRLDASESQRRENDNTIVWDSSRPNAQWPIAVIAARTEQSLLHLAGQARLTYDNLGEAETAAEHWRVPSLCARCRNIQVDHLELYLSQSDENLKIEAKEHTEDSHEQISLEGLYVEGHSLSKYFEGRRRGGRADFELPITSPLAQELVLAVRSGLVRAEVTTTSGELVTPVEVQVRLSSELTDEVDAGGFDYDEEDLPTHLSADLVRSWPNPFEQATTIEITIPSRMSEAFDLDSKLSARVNPADPPPFGTTPTVSVKVFSASGKLVKTLESGSFGPGAISVTWDGQDVRGQTVASGAYYVHVQMGEWSVTRRVLRLGG